jgi:Recombination endonuclease VII
MIEARRLGLDRYFTGKPCKNGHIAERRVIDRGCIPCNNEKARKWQSAHNTPEKNRKWNLAKYGPDTAIQYEILYEQQEGKCASCGDFQPTLFVDHDHKLGKKSGIRGLLCLWCNTAEGYLKGDPERARKLADYMETVNKQKEQE